VVELVVDPVVAVVLFPEPVVLLDVDPELIVLDVLPPLPADGVGVSAQEGAATAAIKTRIDPYIPRTYMRSSFRKMTGR
jgi:hypothetical protein